MACQKRQPRTLVKNSVNDQIEERASERERMDIIWNLTLFLKMFWNLTKKASDSFGPTIICRSKVVENT